MLSFSSLREAKDWEEERLESAPTSTLPLGTKTGILLHSLLENHLRKPNLDEIVVRESDLPLSYRPFQKEIEGLIKQALSMSLFPGGPSAKDLPLEQKYVEMEFTFTMEEAMYKGFIDLLFVYEEKWYIVDWKSNYLGESPASYSPQSLEKYAAAKGYDLQKTIYETALTRYLQSPPHGGKIGGIFFVFLRGGPALLSYEPKREPAPFSSLDREPTL